MPIDFHAPGNRFSYATRQADPSWRMAISNIVDVKGKRVLDIGCGRGIYSNLAFNLTRSYELPAKEREQETGSQ
jgi:2-polyprenyl-3-methyl-5-hydroxy-6-metoxy-1,4-benzoquinol methylase